MKKSDFIRAREKKWRTCPNPATAKQYSILVARDVQAAEAAGIEWDLEDIPLPSRLEIYDTVTGLDTYACLPDPPRHWMFKQVRRPDLGQPDIENLRVRVFQEVVRRYNEWPGEVKPEWWTSLENILEYAQREEGKSQQGYFSRSGGGGRPLHELLVWLKDRAGRGE